MDSPKPTTEKQPEVVDDAVASEYGTEKPIQDDLKSRLRISDDGEDHEDFKARLSFVPCWCSSAINELTS